VFDDQGIETMREETKEAVAQGAGEAEEADWPEPESAADHVYADLNVLESSGGWK
jgi:TPP-dependent pyruvate/acetoin dehydrogenase alpha subunit